MKKIFLTLATLYSSHLFAAQSIQGRFQVNTSRCKFFSGNIPTRAFISARSANSLLIEFLGSEGREMVVYTNSGDDMGRMGRETFTGRWIDANSLSSARAFTDDDGRKAKEVITMTSTQNGIVIGLSTNGGTELTCELIRP